MKERILKMLAARYNISINVNDTDNWAVIRIAGKIHGFRKKLERLLQRKRRALFLTRFKTRSWKHCDLLSRPVDASFATIRVRGLFIVCTDSPQSKLPEVDILMDSKNLVREKKRKGRKGRRVMANLNQRKTI